MKEVAVALGRIAPDGRPARWKDGSGRGIQPNPYYLQGVTLRAELSAAKAAEEAAKIQEDKYQKLAMLSNLKRIPMVGDYYRSGSDGATVYEDQDRNVVAGKIGSMKVFGPILSLASYHKDTDQDFFAGLSVQFMYQTLPDANGKINEFKAWVKISENTSLLCEPVNKPDATIWDDDADQPSTSTGSGTLQEVTPGVASDSQAPAQQMPAIK